MRLAARHIAVAAVALVATLLAPPAAIAGNPVTTTTLSLPSYRDLVVDPTTNRVFVSGGPGTSTILVLDFDGNVTATITEQPGASDLVLDPATSRLYVSLLDEGKISIINTATLAEVQRTTGTLGWNPVLAGGRIWYSPGSGGLTSVALDLTGPVTYEGFGTYPGSIGPLAAASSNPNVLAAGGSGSPSEFYTYDVTGGTPSLLAAGNAGSSLGDIGFSPNGTHVFTAAGAPYEVQDFRTSDLELLTTYPTGPYPGGVDVSPNGGLVAASIDGEVQVYALGNQELRNRYTIGSFEGGLINGSSVAFSPSGTRLFAVTGGGGPAVKFHVLHGADLYGSTLTVGTSTPYVKQPVTVSGDLAFMDGDAAAGVPVELTLVDGVGTRTSIATVNTDSGGHYSYTDPESLPSVGTYTYEASWEGDATHGEAIAEKTLQAQKKAATVKLSVSDAKIRFGQSILVNARLTGGLSNTQIALYAENVHGDRTLLVQDTVDADGRLSLPVKPKANTKYVAEYAGDEAFLAASASRSVTVAVITTSRLSGYYAISGGYRLYHAGHDPVQVGKVVPNHAGKRLTFPVQVKVDGHWVHLGAPRFLIGPDGKASVRWIDPEPGYGFRVRNVFEGDRDHVGDSSPWMYFRIT